ncbi:MAG: phosphatase PAP2 family protein [Nitrospirae bacterium]|nr:phosphatase PAP2 family protein [Nitrospirota bacterium]
MNEINQTSRKAWIWIAALAILFPLAFIEDGQIRGFLKDLRVQVLYNLMRHLTWLGEGWVLLVVAAVLFGVGLWRREQKLKSAGGSSLVALVTAGLTVQIIKHLAGRPRPGLVDVGVVRWGPSFKSGHNSFPSGHAISAFAMAAVLSSYYPAGRWIWYSTAVLVAFSRVYIDAHFTSDVLAGAVLGMLIGLWASRLRVEFLKS